MNGFRDLEDNFRDNKVLRKFILLIILMVLRMIADGKYLYISKFVLKSDLKRVSF